MFEQLVREILITLNVGKREDRTGLSRDLRFGEGGGRLEDTSIRNVSPVIIVLR